MSVSQRSDGRWIVKYKSNGKWMQRSFKDSTTAQAFDAEQTPQDTDTRLSLGELVLTFYKERRDINQHTKKNVVYFLWGHHKDKKWIAGRGAFLSEKYAEELTRQDLQLMREVMLESGSSPATCNKMQSYIRAILAWGVDSELIRINPWRDYKRLRAEKHIIKVSHSDFMRVYAELPEYMQWAAQTAFHLCIRPGMVELFRLLWVAFDFKRGLVRIKQGKSGHFKTVFPHPSYMERAKERFAQDAARGIPLVCHRGGRPVNSYRTAWELACKRANVNMRFYDIRHAAAMALLEAGADISAVAAQMGHSSVSTTLTHYAHATEGGQRRAAELMPALGEENEQL